MSRKGPVKRVRNSRQTQPGQPGGVVNEIAILIPFETQPGNVTLLKFYTIDAIDGTLETLGSTGGVPVEVDVSRLKFRVNGVSETVISGVQTDDTLSLSASSSLNWQVDDIVQVIGASFAITIFGAPRIVLGPTFTSATVGP